MKELGEYLKKTRIDNGVSIDEAAQDLNIDDFLLESIEEGNTRAFKDVLSMKDRIKEYAKYLGLKPEDVIDEFNDYLFEKTSKISLKDIEEAENGLKNKQDETKKISSPYTLVKPKKKSKKPIIYGILGIALLIIIVLIIFSIVRPKKEIITKELKVRSDGEIYELA